MQPDLIDSTDTDLSLRRTRFQVFDGSSAIIDRKVANDSLRDAGRRNSHAVSEKELKALLSERKTLLMKRYSGGLSQREEDRLEYVRWSLDRIEDARHGHSLDDLETIVASYKRAIEELHSLRGALLEHMPRKK